MKAATQAEFFLCGVGVSLPSGMPSFIGLTQYVIDFFDPPEGSKIMRVFQRWIDDPTGTNMPLDQIFNLLHLEYGRDEVNALVAERLQASAGNDEVGHHHNLIKRISTCPNGLPQIVTTNFDLLFEFGGDFPTFAPPAFPDRAFGNSVEGITYLHGRLQCVKVACLELSNQITNTTDMGRISVSLQCNLLVGIQFVERLFDGAEPSIYLRYLTALLLRVRSGVLQRLCPSPKRTWLCNTSAENQAIAVNE